MRHAARHPVLCAAMFAFTATWPALALAQTHPPRQLVGNIEITTKPSQIITVITIDVFKNNKNGDGMIDKEFALVRPTPLLSVSGGLGTIRVPGTIGKVFEHPYIEITFDDGRPGLFASVPTASAEPAISTSRSVHATRILEFGAAEPMDNKRALEYFFKAVPDQAWDVIGRRTR